MQTAGTKLSFYILMVQAQENCGGAVLYTAGWYQIWTTLPDESESCLALWLQEKGQ